MRALLLVCLAICAFAIPRLNIDESQVSVSGLSSGGYFAVQFQVSFSKALRGAGIVAGGPYYCAKGSMIKALSECMSSPFMMDVNSLVSFTKSLPDTKRDPISYLLKHKTLLYSGLSDTVVFQGVMEKLKQYYLDLGVSESDMKVIFNIPSQHAMITNFAGNDCSHLGSPFINNCNLDLAGAILQQIYGNNLTARGEMKESNIESFSQSEFLNGATLASTGYLYIPDACKRNESCKLHIVFHGCKQNYDTIGSDYVKKTGYNQWAESNNIVILYPQTKASMLTNPNGCFDWFGFDDAEYYSKSGKQMSAVRRMIESLSGISFDQ